MYVAFVKSFSKINSELLDIPFKVVEIGWELDLFGLYL